MDNKAAAIESLFERAEQYGKTSFELFKLKAIDKSADIFSSLVAQLAIYIVVALFFLILNIGIALWIGELLGKLFYGFMVVAAFYAFVSIVLHVFRDQWIKKPISNSIVTHMLK